MANISLLKAIAFCVKNAMNEVNKKMARKGPGALKLFEGENGEEVMRQANSFMLRKKTCIAHTHVNVLNGTRKHYAVIVFYDV